jgi:fatty-acyl-CoA synthase
LLPLFVAALYRVGFVRIPLAHHVETAAVLARRGALRPVRPDRLARMGLAFRRWGASIAAAYAVNAIARADQAAVIDDERVLTYSEIDRRTNALANELAKLGIREGERLAVMCRNGAAFVESIVAAGKLGADALPLNTSFSAPEVAAIVARERPPTLIHDAEFAALLDDAGLDASVARVVVGGAPAAEAGASFEELATNGNAAPPAAPSEAGRVVILTSGTTGTPKGARLARPTGLDPLAWFLRVVPIDAGSAYLIPAPLFHAHGFGQLVIGSSLGCTMVLPRRFDAEQMLALIERHRVEEIAVVPVMLKRVMSLPPERLNAYDTSSLRAAVTSGSALDARLARRFIDSFGPVLYNLYGSTELAWATIASPQDLLEAPGTVGRPPPHTRLAILDDEGGPLPTGVTGHVFAGHEMLFEGYTEEGHEHRLVEGMMSAGDLGHVDSEGRLFVDARADDMIISGGENLYPGEIEDALHEHEDIVEAAVVGADDPDFGQRPVAFVVARADSGLTEADVDAFARERLARFKVPRDVVIVEDLPRNALGKVLRRELRPPTDEGRRREVG